MGRILINSHPPLNLLTLRQQKVDLTVREIGLEMGLGKKSSEGLWMGSLRNRGSLSG